MWILLVVIVLALSYFFLKRPHKYWKNKSVVQGNPVFVFGDSWDLILGRQSLCEMVESFYKLNPTGRYVGIYLFLQPNLVLRDPDLIKQITVKDFEHFVDHHLIVSDDSNPLDPLVEKNLVGLTGQKWKDMRSTLSPAFTSSKMKHMFSLLQDGEQFIKHFLKQDKNLITVEMKDAFSRFTNDVIANTTFGVEVDSLAQRKNEFYMMGKEASDSTGLRRLLVLFAYMLIPRFFRIKFFSDTIRGFFNKLVKNNIASREKHGIVRPDIINLLMEARKQGLKYEESQDIPDTGFATVQESEIGKDRKAGKIELTDEDITAQGFIFFFGGFETVSFLMSFMSYELGVNLDIQQKLIQEVDETFAKCKGKLTYEALIGMKYMDMVTLETLRKWPVTPIVRRQCTKPYTIEPVTPDEKPVHLKKGDIVFLPIYGLHKDPQYYPDPDRFDPERFSDENKANIKPYTYIPFGSGPRNCIGSRFALLETKIFFFYMLSNFEIVPVKKTKIPLKLSRKSFNATPKGRVWFGLKRRSK